MKKQLITICICYTIFVIYGSLVPWKYNGLSINEALIHFQNIPYLKLGIASRADWVANILLFIPLAFLWMVRISLQQQLVGKLFTTVFVLASSIFLCTAIEFTQLFFPPRTVSLNDVIAETLGAVIGIAVYWMFGNKFIQWLEAWQKRRSDTEFYLQIYLGVLFFYNVLPLDLTLSPVELYHKWREKRIILLPFGGIKGDVFKDIYDILADIILWVPVPWLWLKKLRLTSGQLLVRVFIAALIIELFQLFVYSRVTDVTDILLAVVGAGIGVGLLGLYNSGYYIQGYVSVPITKEINLLWLVTLYCLWGLIIIIVFWYPYNFQLDYSNSLTVPKRFFSVPFQAYYYGTEFRAITEVFHKVLFLIPIGVISGVIVKQIKTPYKTQILALSLVAFWALTVEFGQLFLPNKNADITDLILEILGGYFGVILSHKIYRFNFHQIEADRFSGEAKYLLSQVDSKNLIKSNMARLGWLFSLISVIFVFGILILASQSQSVPYNLRELFSSEYPVLSAFGITLLLYWCFTYPPFYLLNLLSKNIGKSCFFFKALIIHALGAWLLIRIIVPIESIHDIIGSPILSIPNEFEMSYRFLALFAVYSLTAMGASHCALLSVISSREFKRLFFLGGFGLVFVLPICFWIVVVDAATDNLTELMDNGGYSFYIINILLYLFLFSWLGSFAALTVVFKRIKNIFPLMIAFIISFPLGYQLLSWGTEQFILKYNTVFSAMQFLLSSDRQNLISENAQRVRFFITHLSMILFVFLTQVPVLMIYYDATKTRNDFQELKG